MIDAQLYITYVAAGVFVVAALLSALRASGLRASWRVGLVLVALLALRVALTRPTLLHADFHAIGLLDSAIRDPTFSLRNYGPLSFLVLGNLMRALGPRLEVVAAVGHVAGVITLAAMAWMAWQVSGSRRAGAMVLAAAALSPVLMRVAGSEDSHTLAVMFGWVALAAADGYAASRRPELWLLAIASVALMLVTRQTMFVFAPCVPLYAAARSRWRAVGWPEFWVGAALMLAVLGLRVAISMESAENVFQMSFMLKRLASPRVVLEALRRHPQLDLERFSPHLVPLQIAGFVWLARRAAPERLLALFGLGLFLWMFPIWEGQGAGFTFRLPGLTFGFFAAGLGAHAAVDRLVARGGRWEKWSPPAMLAALTALPLALPGRGVVREHTTAGAEFEYIRDAVPELPRRFMLVVLPEEEGQSDPGRASSQTDRSSRPGYVFPRSLLELAGLDVAYVNAAKLAPSDLSSDLPVLFMSGAQCYAYNLPELLHMRVWELLVNERASLAGITNRLPPGVSVPPGPRQQCALLQRGAVPATRPRTVSTRAAEWPFILYGRDAIDLQFVRLAPAALSSLRPSRRIQQPDRRQAATSAAHWRSTQARSLQSEVAAHRSAAETDAELAAHVRTTQARASG